MGACSQIGINCEQTIARQRDIEYPQDTKCTARQQNRDGIAALLKYLKKFVQEVNFYPLQGAYGEGNNNFLIFILFFLIPVPYTWRERRLYSTSR